jgi:hypothetical protein
LEPLLEEWKAKPGWLEEEMAIVRMVRDQISLTTASQEDILRINAICNTNTFRYHPSTISQEDILRINAICNTNTFRYTASPQPRRRTSSGLTPSTTPTPSGTQPHHSIAGGHPQD